MIEWMKTMTAKGFGERAVLIKTKVNLRIRLMKDLNTSAQRDEIFKACLVMGEQQLVASLFLKCKMALVLQRRYHILFCLRPCRSSSVFFF